MKQVMIAGILVCSSLAAQWKAIDPPAHAQSGMPFLTKAPDGAVYLSWIDILGEGNHALRYSRWDGKAWGAAETIAQGKNWFVNWADFPAIEVMRDGSMMAHWLARPDSGGKYGYGIRVARKGPAASDKWVETAAMNEKDLVDYAGFLNFAGSAAVYLSPEAKRGPAAAHADHDAEGHIKTLRFVKFGADGRPASDIEIDGDVCSCCQTSVAATKSGLIAAYRDHLPGEIRDISILRFDGKEWSKPTRVHRDGWKINGCPTEGPSISVAGDKIGVAWLTRAGETPKLQVALSQDEGKTFGAPIRGDDGKVSGRPSLAAVSERESLLVWLEKVEQGAELRLRRIYADGRKGESLPVAKVAASRSTGLPQLAIDRDEVLVAWREERVRVVRIPLGSIPLAR